MFRWWLTLVGLLGLAACDPRGGAPEPRERQGAAATRHAARRPTPPAAAVQHDMARIGGGIVGLDDPHGRRHVVAVADFAIDRTEVTVREYWRCVSAGGCRPRWTALKSECNFIHPDRRDHPMNCVGREEAEQYCRWRDKRLPTMAEWHRAAAGNDRPHPWGTAPPDGERVCWQTDGTCEVASRPQGATPEGVYDLAGNVWEISEPVCSVVPPRAGMCGDYTAAVHGGGWDSCPSHRPGCPDGSLAALVSTLASATPEAVGFRCARDVR